MIIIENTFAKIIWDLDEFMQREGDQFNFTLLRSKLRLLHSHVDKNTLAKKRLRGLLNRINKLSEKLLVLRVVDLLIYFRKIDTIAEFSRKIRIRRIEKPTQILKLIENSQFPLKIEYDL